jgi:putative transcriptional regulator
MPRPNQGEEAKRLRNRLPVLRAESRMTQEDLAQRTGVTRVTISCIERGEYVPSLTLAFKLARCFARRIDEVFDFEEEGTDE